MLESKYQGEIKARIEARLPGCIVMKNDCNDIQGIPDLTILYGAKWAFLEVKASEKSRERPNQRHYITKADSESFAAFIYPLVEEQVLNDLVYYMTCVRC